MGCGHQLLGLGLRQQGVAFKLFDLTMHAIEFKAWTLGKEALLPPHSFAALLSNDADVQATQLARRQREWDVVLAGEKRATVSEPWRRVMKDLHFLAQPLVRISYMIIDQEGGVAVETRSWFTSMFLRKGDSRIVENVFHDLRHMALQSTNHVTALTTLHRGVTVSPSMVRSFGDRTVAVTSEMVEQVTVKDSGRWKRRLYKSERHQLPKSFSEVLLPCSQNSWRSPSLAADNATLAAWQWLFRWADSTDVSLKITDNWQSTFFDDHTFVTNISTNESFYIVSATSQGCICYRCPFVTNAFGDGGVFTIGQSPLDFLFMRSIREWVAHTFRVIPRCQFRMIDVSGTDAMIALQIRETVPLLQNAFTRARKLTKARLVELVHQYGADVPSRSTKKDLERLLLDAAFPDETEDFKLSLLHGGSVQADSANDKMNKALESHPLLAAGIELLRDIDAEQLKDFEPISRAIDVAGPEPKDQKRRKHGFSDDESESSSSDSGNSSPESNRAVEESGHTGCDEGTAAQADEVARHDSGSPSEASGSDSQGSSSQSEAEPAPKRRIVTNRTPPALRDLVPNLEAQAIGQDVRENRFSGRDSRSSIYGTDELNASTFSRVYGGRSSRTHQEALCAVVEWLRRKDEFFTEGAKHDGPVLPEVLPESLAHCLSVPVQTGYYFKSRR